MDELISTKELTKLVGLSETTIYHLRKAGEFFSPVQLSKRRIAWRIADAKAWLASR